MAKVKLGPILTDIRGTTKEVIWTRTGKSGIGAKSQAGTHNNPQSQTQAQVRLCVTLASRAWNDSLSQAQRDAWNALAKSISDQTGEACNVRNLIPQTRGILSGFNIFLALYVPVCRCNIPITPAFYDPPLGLTPPSAITDLTAVWTSLLLRNYALSFDGVDENINLGNVLGYDYNQPQSWEFWWWWTPGVRNDTLSQKFEPTGNDGYNVLNINGNLYLGVLRLSAAEGVQISRVVGGIARWIHIVATYDGSNNANGMRFYVDTVPGQAITFNVPITGSILTTAPLFFAGTPGFPAGFAQGIMDCTRNYNRVITPAEVITLFNAGAGLYGADPFGDGSCQGAWMFCTGSGVTLFDISGNAYHGTLQNMEPGDWVAGKVPCPTIPNNITLTWTDPVTVTAGSKVRIWLRSRELGVHKQLNACVDIGDEAIEITQVRMAHGVPHDITDFPGHYLIQADVIQPNGYKSPPSNTVEVVVP